MSSPIAPITAIPLIFLSMNNTNSSKTNSAFADFLEIIATLRGPDGCPWDKEQTEARETAAAQNTIVRMNTFSWLDCAFLKNSAR